MEPHEKRRKFFENFCMVLLPLSIIIFFCGWFQDWFQGLDVKSWISRIISGYFIGGVLIAAEEFIDELVFSDRSNFEAFEYLMGGIFLIFAVFAYCAGAWGDNTGPYFVIGLSIVGITYKHAKNGYQRVCDVRKR